MMKLVKTFQRLKYIDGSNNLLDTFILSNLSYNLNFTYLDLSNNQLSGDINLSYLPLSCKY